MFAKPQTDRSFTKFGQGWMLILGKHVNYTVSKPKATQFNI